MGAYLAVASVIIATAFTAAGNGMMATFVPVRLDLAGIGQDAVGLVVTAYAVGLLLGCVFSGHVMRRVGHIRAFATFAATGTISALLMSAWVTPAIWIVLRIAGGFCTTAMFLAAQSWLNEVTSTERRGRVMSLFYLGYTVSLGLGALVMNRVAADTATPFLVLAGLYAAAVIPIGLTRLETPPAPERIAVRLREVYRISPVGLVGAYASGSLGMTMMGVGPMYGTAIGLSAPDIALAMAALQVGNLAIQWPLGWLSDRVDRRHVIAGAALAVVAVSGAILAVGDASLVTLVFLFGLWGGMAESIYAVSTAHANDRTPAGDYVVVSSTVLVVWATGSTVGPMIATAALRALGPAGIWIFFIAVAGGFAGFVAWRAMRRDRPREAQQEHFHAVPASPQIPEWSPYWHEDDGQGSGPASATAEARP
ncbi:MAG: MFS transporter [Halofilum sp. (in: g-proteobacteria)]|nr:MFS transporter [Halofilum sp. (in: g-proteobacteria)]